MLGNNNNTLEQNLYSEVLVVVVVVVKFEIRVDIGKRLQLGSDFCNYDNPEIHFFTLRYM